jgi:VPDSG-CTERM motif
MKNIHVLKVSALALALAGVSQNAMAQIPYPNSGTPNPTTYVFTAASTGDVVAYFAGSGASFDEQVGMIDTTTSIQSAFGLDDHTSTVGQAFDFGAVTAGDTLVFVDQIETGSMNGDVYSDPSLNGPWDGTPGDNHVYSTAASAGEAYSGSPAGTYVAFEDLPFPQSDFNYFDDTFVFTNVATNSVPDSASTLALLGGAMTGLAALRRRFRK